MTDENVKTIGAWLGDWRHLLEIKASRGGSLKDTLKHVLAVYSFAMKIENFEDVFFCMDEDLEPEHYTIVKKEVV